MRVKCLCLLGLVGLVSAMWLAPCSAAETKYCNEATAKPDWKPLPIELPTPMFQGTPKDIVSPNLEPITGEKRKPFLAPEGVANVAVEKPVTSSDDDPIQGEIEQITDNDLEGAEGSYIEMKAGLQWVQIDLEKVCEVYAIVVWHYHAEARVYCDVVVRTASDPDFILDVETVFNNDHDNSSGLGIGKDKEYIETNEGKLIDLSAKPVKTRYVRLYSNGNTSNDMNHYIEVEIFGR